MIDALSDTARPAAREVRWEETWLASLMVAGGLALVEGGSRVPTLPGFPAPMHLPEIAGPLALVLGSIRLVALSGAFGRRAGLVRTAGCGAGFLLDLSAAALAIGADLPSASFVFGILALAELHASGRSARDACRLGLARSD